jgi:hypothetical protein
MKQQDFGLTNTLDIEFHTFTCTVTPRTITMWIDGVETRRYANPLHRETCYPFTNAPVKALSELKDEDGNGVMVLKSLKIWHKE